MQESTITINIHIEVFFFLLHLTITSSELGAQVFLCGELGLLLGEQGSGAS